MGVTVKEENQKLQELFTNAVTEPKRRTDGADKNVPKKKMLELIEIAKKNLKDDELYVWNANINGVIVQLRTNSFHQYDFWVDNWFPADFDVRPDAVVWSVNGVGGTAPYAYFCLEMMTVVFFNTNYYGQCKSWSLGLADAVLRPKGVHSIHGSCVDVAGRGTVMIAPTGTGKSTHVAGLLELPNTNIHSDDWLYLTYPSSDGKVRWAEAAISERNFYVRTDTAKESARMKELFFRCKTENVVTQPGQCIAKFCNTPAPDGKRQCMFEEGCERCFWGFPNSRAILDPTWIAGQTRFVRKTKLAHVIFLTRDDQTPVQVKLEPSRAIEILKEGKYMVLPGAGAQKDWGTYKNEAWYNPYLLNVDHPFQEDSFRKLMSVADAYIINTGKASIQENQERIRKIALS